MTAVGAGEGGRLAGRPTLTHPARDGWGGNGMDGAGKGLGSWLWEERGNILTLLTFIGSSVLALLIFYVPYVEGQLKTNPTYQHLKAKQLSQPHWIVLYRGWLVATLDRLDRWMGRPEDWRRGFGWCVRAGLAYSFGFAFLAWVLGVPTELGDLLIFTPVEFKFGVRLFTIGLIVGGGVFVYLIFRYLARTGALIDAWLAMCLPATISEERRRGAVGWILGSLIGVLLVTGLQLVDGLRHWTLAPVDLVASAAWGATFAVASATATSRAGIGAVVPAVAWAVAVTLVAYAAMHAVLGVGAAGAGALALALILAGAGAVTAVVILTGAAAIVVAVYAGFGLLGTAELAHVVPTSVVLFGLLLPLLNAVFDWLSWLVGRWLGRDLAESLGSEASGGWRRFVTFVLHVGAEVALAVVSLVGMAWGIPRAIELFNAGLRVLGSPTPLALGDYLCRSALNPLGEGLWASLTLLSTFVPTAVHLGFLPAAPSAWLLSRGEVWQARARHLRGQGLPPAVDLGPDATADASADSLHPETIRQVALHLALVRPVLWTLAGLVAGVLIYAVLELLALDWGSLSRLLLYVATGDPVAVAICFGDGMPIVKASAAPP